MALFDKHIFTFLYALLKCCFQTITVLELTFLAKKKIDPFRTIFPAWVFIQLPKKYSLCLTFLFFLRDKIQGSKYRKYNQCKCNKYVNALVEASSGHSQTSLTGCDPHWGGKKKICCQNSQFGFDLLNSIVTAVPWLAKKSLGRREQAFRYAQVKVALKPRLRGNSHPRRHAKEFWEAWSDWHQKLKAPKFKQLLYTNMEMISEIITASPMAIELAKSCLGWMCLPYVGYFGTEKE